MIFLLKTYNGIDFFTFKHLSVNFHTFDRVYFIKKQYLMFLLCFSVVWCYAKYSTITFNEEITKICYHLFCCVLLLAECPRFSNDIRSYKPTHYYVLNIFVTCHITSSNGPSLNNWIFYNKGNEWTKIE